MTGAKIVIIDPQNDFTSPDGAYAKRHGITQITQAKVQINKLLTFHKKDSVVVLRSDYRHSQFVEGMSLCVPGTFGNQIDHDLALNDRFISITKHEHSGLTSVDFTTYLEISGTVTLVLCGFLAEYCVRQTALDALQAGYKVYLVDDCIGTGDDVQERKKTMLKELASIGAVIVDSNTIPIDDGKNEQG